MTSALLVVALGAAGCSGRVNNFSADVNIKVCVDGVLRGSQPDGKCGTEGDVPIPDVPIRIELTRANGNVRIDRKVRTNLYGEINEVFTGANSPGEDINISAQVPEALIVPFGDGSIIACQSKYLTNPSYEIKDGTKFSQMNGTVVYQAGPGCLIRKDISLSPRGTLAGGASV